jgi:1-deoxyxylulose-5-phosphate synthase
VVRYVQLGASGLRVSELILGAARFGEIDDREADRLVGASLDAGITTFDVADIYNGGVSEELLGKAIRARRDQVVLCSKVGLRVGDGEVDHTAAFAPGGLDHAARWSRGIAPTDQGLSRKHVTQAVDDSLRRLGTDHLDLYQVHKWDDSTPIEETMGVLDDLVRAGKVRYLGCSAFAAWQVQRAVRASEARHLQRLVSIQAPYNLAARDAERELVPACLDAGVGILAFQVLAGGLFAGRYRPDQTPDGDTRMGSRAVYRNRYWNQQMFDLVDRLGSVASERGRTLTELAVGWTLTRPAVTAVIFGASAASQLQEAVAVLDRPLDGDELAALEDAVAG